MRFSRRRILGIAGAAAAAPCAARVGWAQAYPSRPVKVIVPVAAGGANDTTARLFAQKLSDVLGQQFYVENLAGAGGNLGIGTAARAPADGYTLLAAGGNFVINPSLYAKVPYDPRADFAPVSLMCSSPHLLAVHPSVAGGHRQRIRGAGQSEPGQVQLCVGGSGHAGASRGRAVQARIRARHDARAVHRRRPGDHGHARGTHALHRLGAAHRSALRQSRQRARARDDERQTLLTAPGRADHGGSNRHGLEADIVTGLVAPAGTPRAIIDLLQRAIGEIIAPREFRDRLLGLGFDPVASTPEHFAAWIETEIAKWGKVIRDGAISAQ